MRGYLNPWHFLHYINMVVSSHSVAVSISFFDVFTQHSTFKHRCCFTSPGIEDQVVASVYLSNHFFILLPLQCAVFTLLHLPANQLTIQVLSLGSKLSARIPTSTSYSATLHQPTDQQWQFKYNHFVVTGKLTVHIPSSISHSVTLYLKVS